MGKKAKADKRQTRKIQEQLQVRTGSWAELHTEPGLGQYGNWTDSTGWTQRAAEREGSNGAVQDTGPMCTSPRARDSKYMCMFNKIAALNYCRQTCPIIQSKLMVPAPHSSISVVKSMS